MICASETLEDIRRTHLRYDLPWCVAFSGGKDSTTVLQLVYQMLLELPSEQRTHRVDVLSVDTGVENPLMWLRIHDAFKKIEASAKRDGLPLTTHLLHPPLEHTFWVMMLGNGLSPPRYNFRWCTGNLKIKPQRTFVRGLGRVIGVVGDRIAESAGRGDRMRKSGLGIGTYICQHPGHKRSLKYSPIADWSDVDVFAYLRSTPSPWGDDNAVFLDMHYGTASHTFGECLHACGGRTPRSGCWVCTVATSDRSVIVPDLAPLRDYRQHLLQVMRDREHGSGRLPMNVRKTLLDDLMKVVDTPSVAAWCEEHQYTVISRAEIDEIHRLWATK